MKNKLTNNIPLKIMSVVVGILVWLIVVNIDNPITTNSYVLHDVEILNEAYVDDTGKMVRQDEDQDTIRVYITGERKTLDKINNSDIKAVADLQQAVSLETDPVMVPITVTCPGIHASNIKVTPQNLSLHLEEMSTQEFAVNINLEGQPGKGYEIGTQTVTPEKVRITGPKSLINKIDKVNVNVGVNGITEDVTEECGLTIIDKNQDSLVESQMNNLKIDASRVTVSTKLWKVRSDVKISADYNGEPADGYVVDSITTVPGTISVAGTDQALENLRLQGNTIYIDKENVDISEKSSDVEVKISLLDLLPDGLKLTSNTSEDVWVRVNILPQGSKAYTVSTGNIKVKNKPDDLQVAFEIAEVEVRVKAEDGNFEGFRPDSIKASIDMEDREEGNYEVPVKITLPDGYELLNDVSIEVKVSKISSAEENNE